VGVLMFSSNSRTNKARNVQPISKAIYRTSMFTVYPIILILSNSIKVSTRISTREMLWAFREFLGILPYRPPRANLLLLEGRQVTLHGLQNCLAGSLIYLPHQSMLISVLLLSSRTITLRSLNSFESQHQYHGRRILQTRPRANNMLFQTWHRGQLQHFSPSLLPALQ
jgi:hypothetical protein